MYLERQKKYRWILNGKRVPASTPGARKTLERSPYYSVVIPLHGKGKKKITLKGVTNKEVAMQYLLRMKQEGADSLLGLSSLRPDAEDHPIGNLLKLYLKEQRSSGNSSAYVQGMSYYPENFFRGIPQNYLSQLQREELSSHLESKVSRKGKKWSARARNYCRQFLVRFGRWCKKHRYWKKNLFKGIPTFKGVAVKVRRPLTLRQIQKLIRAARLRVLFQARPKKASYQRYLADKGRERALLYTFLFTVVCRLGAALKLQAGHLSLGIDHPTVSFPAGNVKKRRMIIKPLPSSMARQLAEWIRYKKIGPDQKIFSLSSTMTRDFYKDLDFARIPRKHSDGTSVDIHSLKTSAISFLGGKGVEGKMLQDIGEHEKLETTYGHYLRLGAEEYQRVGKLFEEHFFQR